MCKLECINNKIILFIVFLHLCFFFVSFSPNFKIGGSDEASIAVAVALIL
jgi:hypothetical protein